MTIGASTGVDDEDDVGARAGDVTAGSNNVGGVVDVPTSVIITSLRIK